MDSIWLAVGLPIIPRRAFHFFVGEGAENHGLAGGELKVNLRLIGGALPSRRYAGRASHWVENDERFGRTSKSYPTFEIGFSAVGDKIIPATVKCAAGERKTPIHHRFIS